MHTDARYRFRQLLRCDVDLCVEIEAKCYPPSVCEGAEAFRRLLSASPSGCFAVVDDCDQAKPYDTAIVGYALCIPLIFEEDCPLELSGKAKLPRRDLHANTLYLHDLAVVPEHRSAGVATILQQAVADLARHSEIRTITLTAVCGAAPYWRRRGFFELHSDANSGESPLSEAALERLRSYPAEAGKVALMQHDLLRPRRAESTDDCSPELSDGSSPSAAAPAATPAAAEAGVPPSRPCREIGIPPKVSSAPRTRLAMRLARLPPAELLAREPPPPYRIVEYGRQESYPGIDYMVRACDFELSWAQIVHEAGERPSLDEARAQWQKDFAPFEEGQELRERMFFALDADNQAVGTATAWFEPASEKGASEEGEAKTVGRVHWVALRPEAQGKGLAKPMLAQVLRTLQTLHPAEGDGVPPIRLKTHCQAARAVGMYLEAGFVPAPLDGGDDIQRFSEAEGEGWQMLMQLGLPIQIPGTQLD